MFDGAQIDSDMEVKNLSTDYNLETPHFADIIYSVVERKKLDIHSVFKFITLVMNTSKDISVIDTELINYLKNFEYMNKELCSRPGFDFDHVRKIILEDYSKLGGHASHASNLALPEIRIVRMYLRAMTKFCKEDSVAAEEIKQPGEIFRDSTLESKSYRAAETGCLGVFIIIAFCIMLGNGGYLLITHLLSS